MKLTIDPRPKHAQSWKKISDSYAEELQKSNAKTEIIKGLIQERERIQNLFASTLKVAKEKIFIIVTANTQSEHLSVTDWKGDVFVFISAKLLARPIDDPEENGEKGWQWLVKHESAHVQKGHITPLVYTRKFFNYSSYALLGATALHLSLPAGFSWYHTALYSYLGSWLLYFITSYSCEIHADYIATKETHDKGELEDGLHSLSRMNGSLGYNPLKWLKYFVNLILVDPHPPTTLRKWFTRFLARQTPHTHAKTKDQ